MNEERERDSLAAVTRNTRGVVINIIANFGGQLWAAGLLFGSVPIYVRLLGMESYGLIGAYLAVLGTMRGLDLGFSHTVNREMARLRSLPSQRADMRDVGATFELLFAVAGLSTVALAAAFAYLGANEWLDAEHLSASRIRDCALLASLCLGLQWLPAFYQSVLMGVERQVVANKVRAVEATVAHGGALLLMSTVAPRVESFFVVQIAAYGLSVLLYRTAVGRALPKAQRRGRVRIALVRASWRFSTGVAVISATGAVLLNVDKLVVSRLVPLKEFGSYSISFLVASGVTLVATAVLNAVFPRLTTLIARGAEIDLRKQYHLFAQLLSVVTLPLSLMLAFYAEPVLLLWTADPHAAEQGGPLLRAFALGAGLNALMHAPFALQLAAGWTRIGVTINLGLVALCIPSMLFAVPHYGLHAAGYIWLGLMALYVVTCVPWTHTRLIRGDAMRWLTLDVLPTLLVSALLFGAAWLQLRDLSSALQAVSVGLATLLIAVTLSALAHGQLRQLLFDVWGSTRRTGN